MRLVVAGVLLGLVGTASAQDAYSLRSEFSASHSIIDGIKPRSTSTALVVSNGGGGVVANGPVRFQGPMGRELTANLRVTLTGRAVLGLGARALAGATGVGAAAMLAYEVYDALRVRPNESGSLPHDLLWDPGQPIEGGLDEVFGGTSRGTCPNASYVEAAWCLVGVAQAARRTMACPPNDTNSDSFNRPYRICNYSYWLLELNNGSWAGTYTVTVYRWPAVVGQCPVDMATGTRPNPGFDGKCPTGSYTQGISAEEAAQMRYSSSLPQPDMAALWREALGRGVDELPEVGSETRIDANTIDPFTVPAGTSVTTLSDGSTIEEKVEYKPGAGLSGFNAGTRTLPVPWAKTTTKTTKNPAGEPTGTETKTDVPPSSGAGTGSGSGNPADPCVDDPGRLGCIGLGSIPEEPDLPGREIAMTADPDSGWGSFTATCPAPRTVTVAGRSITIDNSLVCDYLALVRWLVVSFAALAGIRIILGGLER